MGKLGAALSVPPYCNFANFVGDSLNRNNIFELNLYKRNLIISDDEPTKVYIPIDVFKVLTTILEEDVFCNKVFSEPMKNDLIFLIHKSRSKILFHLNK